MYVPASLLRLCVAVGATGLAPADLHPAGGTGNDREDWQWIRRLRL
jgi:hypothetical protein